MKIFTYKNFPAINMNNVAYFQVAQDHTINGGNYVVRFRFAADCVDWPADSEDHANNIYNSILDHLNDPSCHLIRHVNII